MALGFKISSRSRGESRNIGRRGVNIKDLKDGYEPWESPLENGNCYYQYTTYNHDFFLHRVAREWFSTQQSTFIIIIEPIYIPCYCFYNLYHYNYYYYYFYYPYYYYYNYSCSSVVFVIMNFPFFTK